MNSIIESSGPFFLRDDAIRTPLQSLPHLGLAMLMGQMRLDALTDAAAACNYAFRSIGAQLGQLRRSKHAFKRVDARGHGNRRSKHVFRSASARLEQLTPSKALSNTLARSGMATDVQSAFKTACARKAGDTDVLGGLRISERISEFRY